MLLPATRRLLLVEDEPSLRLPLGDRLRAEGYAVTAAPDAATALVAEPAAFDLVVLDVMLPDASGFDVVQTLRRRGSDVPVLMLTARDALLDKVLGLKLGADDYLTKPFAIEELLARLEALLRRAPTPSAGGPETFRFGEAIVDLRSGVVTSGGTPVELSSKEYRLLRHFVLHRGRLLTREALLREVWGYDALPVTRTVDVHVASLRHKLGDTGRTPRHLVTVHGLGYRFEA
ncbi:MAG TPA: response regulator transcription factor [Rhodothermales bacterium]|nr:response regulator transcription factor [Rhodothermales bacterium]